VKFDSHLFSNMCALYSYNRVIVITNYANSATRDYMTSREVHVLVVSPASEMESISAVLTVAKEHRLSIARLRTAGRDVPGFLDRGDVVMELVGIAGQNGENFQADVNRVNSQMTVSEVPIEEITVGCQLSVQIVLKSSNISICRHTWTDALRVLLTKMSLSVFSSLTLSSLVRRGRVWMPCCGRASRWRPCSPCT
jgi:hypothetical protein